MLIFLFPVLLLLLSCAEEFERDNPTDPHNIHITYGSLADSRDGKTYKTVVIGEQTWMAENLNYETVSGSYCYSDSNCDKYGRLYDWETAMYACPAGWHLPSKDEWDVLTNFAGDANNLKARDGWADYYINGVLQHGNGIDYYGFAALPNGGSKAYWWSSSEYGNAINATGAYEYIISEGVKYISNNGADKISNLSVRCIKNYQLCGSGTFDPGRQFCSDNVVHDLCNGIEYDPVNHRCGNDNIVETKCGGSWYNESQRCGTDNIIEDPCGSDWYNAQTHFCDGDNDITELCNGKTYDTGEQFCLDNAIVDLCDGKEYNPITQICEEETILTKCGTDFYNSKTHFCSNAQIIPLCNGKDYNTETQICDNGIIECNAENNDMHYCSEGVFKEYGFIEYGEQTYKTVVIGEQTWMAENLNYNATWMTEYNATGSKCYDDLPSNCDKYGRLYDWITAMAMPTCYNYASCDDQINIPHQGICPEGWHIPSDLEWDELLQYIDARKEGSGRASRWDSYNSYTAGKYLKAKEGWNEYDGVSGNGTDSYGFAALPSGSFNSGNNSEYYGVVGNRGNWWSSTADNYDVHYRYMEYDGYDSDYVNTALANKWSDFLSVRCIKDKL